MLEFGEVIPRLPAKTYTFEEMVGMYHWDMECLYRLIEEGIVYYTNLEREKAGLSPLIWVEDGYCFAKIRADECLEYFAHERLDGRAFYTAYSDYNIKYAMAGENLIKTGWSPNATPREFESYAQYLVDAWMNSPGHRANILRAEFQYICVAVSNIDGVTSAVQNFFADRHW